MKRLKNVEEPFFNANSRESNANFRRLDISPSARSGSLEHIRLSSVFDPECNRRVEGSRVESRDDHLRLPALVVANGRPGISGNSRSKRVFLQPQIVNSILLPLIIFATILSISGCQAKEKAKSDTQQTIPVKAMKVELKDLLNKLEYAGNIKAEDEAVVYPKVSGKIVEKVKEDGSSVDKGDVIAYIDRDEVGLKFEKAPVESPISGIIGRIYVNIGSNVSSQTPVALVVNMDKVKVNLDIPEIYLPKIFVGQEADLTVDAYPENIFLGKVTKISPVVNLENRAAPVEITVDNSEHLLKSGMFVRVSLVIEKHAGVPTIIKEAIIGKEPDTYVYLVENNKAKLRKISLGIHDGSLYEVTEGLKNGEEVVIMGQQRLYDDAQVFAEIGNGNGLSQ